jgi:hypothetical protein
MNLQIVEAAPTVIPFQMDARGAKPAASYQAVRFNAMKHGILSRLAVLAHEDHAEFDDLLAALVEEHRPAGMTEQHLIEELAAIIWRKRRVLMAEGARINEGLKSVVNNAKSVATSAAPFQRGLSAENADLQDLMTETPEQIAETQRDAELDLAATRKAAAILHKGGPAAYDKALRALRQDSRDCWQEQIEEEEHPATAEGLAQFIRETLGTVMLARGAGSPICPGDQGANPGRRSAAASAGEAEPLRNAP